ncbi:RidA family protein [Sphingobacterium sp. DK4209]|uniref:RidA family protein n=1 Tax=Sphingobacterium zhuxiongii TaxID=2662364 RepID=A0A5Q0QH38_9SPHI|nr:MULTISPECIES: RidA family protein [unclassified Sphingobacterium]MVZ64705.1 RidA family protein [Sphingobacterium sp. DK4209]QGA27042.1 RidA family protein [Sphingobacterium sp. dk4302]
MEKEFVFGKDVPQSHLPFSPGVKCGQFLFISGQASVDMDGKIVNDTFENECRRSFDNLKRIVEAAGLTMADIVQVRNYVAEEKDLVKFNEIYREYFSAPFPARTTLIGCLGTILKFEVDATAFIK